MITHRTMTVEELDRVLDWAADEGWNPGLDDAAAFHAADPEGFFLALDDATPVAAISVVNHTDDFAFLGLYLCRPDYRGRGIGYGLWRHALAHAGDRTVGLDGVPAQQDNYRTSGFVLAGETTRYTGRVPVSAPASMRRARPADIPELIALEAAASGVCKDVFLGGWFADTASRQTFTRESDGRIRGAITCRRCRTGYKIGPLIAEGLAAARELMGGVAALTGGTVFSVDVPSESPGLARLSLDMGMSPGFATARMYRGDRPPPGDLVYCAATLEVG